MVCYLSISFICNPSSELDVQRVKPSHISYKTPFSAPSLFCFILKYIHQDLFLKQNCCQLIFFARFCSNFLKALPLHARPRGIRKGFHQKILLVFLRAKRMPLGSRTCMREKIGSCSTNFYLKKSR